MLSIVKRIALAALLSLGVSSLPVLNAGATSRLPSPTHVHVTIGNGTATVSWVASRPATKNKYYEVVAMPVPLTVTTGALPDLKTKANHVTFRGLKKGGKYSIELWACGFQCFPQSHTSKTVNAGTFIIGGGTPGRGGGTPIASGGNGVGGGSGGNTGGGVSNDTLIQDCAIVLGNWVISSYNANQSNEIPPIIYQFGSTSPITQWALAQLGTFASNMFLQGQTAADSALTSVAVTECALLQSGGTDITSIPAPQ